MLELNEHLSNLLIDFETCPFKLFLKKMGQIEVTMDNVEILRAFSTKIKKHEDDLRVQRQKLESRIRSHIIAREGRIN